MAEGIDVSLDAYPYNAAGTFLAATIPPVYHAGGKEKLLECLNNPGRREEIKAEIYNSKTQWENMVENCGFDGILVTKNATRESEGKTIAEYAKEIGRDPIDAIFDILLKTNGNAFVALFGMSEIDIRQICKRKKTIEA